VPCKVTVLLYRVLLDRPFPSTILFVVTISLVPPSSSPSSCTSSHTAPPPPSLEHEEEKEDGGDKEERFLGILQLATMSNVVKDDYSAGKLLKEYRENRELTTMKNKSNSSNQY
jgi:hypothetical protein